MRRNNFRARIWATVIITFCASLTAHSQNSYPQEWNDYLTPEYYFALKWESVGRTEDGAESVKALLDAARADVASQIQVSVSRETGLDVTSTGGVGQSVFVSRTNISTNVTLRFVESRTFFDKKKKTSYALAFISKEDLKEIYSARARKVTQMLDVAIKAEGEKKYDVALKYNYWALVLGSTLSAPDQPQYQGGSSMLHARNRIESILEGIEFKYIGRSKEDDLLGLMEVTCNGEPVATLDYFVNDGFGKSAPMQARDGVGLIEFRANMDVRAVDIEVEYTYLDESVTDPEMQLALREIQQIRFVDSYKAGVSVKEQATKKAKKTKVQEPPAPVTSSSATLEEFSKLRIAPVRDSGQYVRRVNTVLDAIVKKDYDSCRDLFSDEGYDIFCRLLKYGNAKIIDRPQLSCIGFDGMVFCRSIPMRFSFANNYKSFLENVVFSFDADGKIGSICFAIEAESAQDILSKTKWADEAKMVLITFLENYKTAFALKNLEYISSVFADDALIITGRKVTPTVVEGPSFTLTGEAYEYNRQTKSQYIRNLSRSFASKEYINLKFSNVLVLKTERGTNRNLYGIQVRQDYFSSNYGDSGYLYILLDIDNSAQPLIRLRTWQPEPDPEFGIYGINNI